MEVIPASHISAYDSGSKRPLIPTKSMHQLPETKEFNIYKFTNPKTKRQMSLLECDHAGCHKYFRKWHNFFDHLRIHTGERPFSCPFEECQITFTQKSNLTKHMTNFHSRSKLVKVNLPRHPTPTFCYPTFDH